MHGGNPKPEVPLSTLVQVLSTRKPFLTLRPSEHTKSGKYGRNANIRTYIPIGHQGPYNITYTQTKRTIVSAYKHTYYMGQVLPWIRSQSCMHMGRCAKSSPGVYAHKAILYRIVDRLERIEQAIHNALCALSLSYCLSSRLLASRTRLGATPILAKFLEEKSSLQATMFWYTLNCMEPSLS